VEGCGTALRLVHAIQSELSVRPLYEGAPSYVESLDRLRTHGYELSGVYPLERDRDLGIIEFDCIMIRRESQNKEVDPSP
jgi:hypothetical protein